MKVPTFAQAPVPVSLEDAAAELALRIASLDDAALFLALERRLRPEEVDEIAGRPAGWAYREIHAGRLPYEKDPGEERKGRGRVGAVRVVTRKLLAELVKRTVEARAAAPRPYRHRPEILAKIRSRHQAAAGVTVEVAS